VRRLSLCVALVCLLAACSRPGSVPPPNAQQQPPAITITLLAFGRSAALEAVVGKFQRTHPDIRVQVEYAPTDTRPRLSYLTDRLRRGGIDVVQVDNLGHALIVQGLLLPLNDRIERSRLDLAPFGFLLNGLSLNNRLYQLPLAIYPEMLVYNPDLFAAAGVTPPPADGWTWEQFRETARLLARGEGENRVWGFSAPVVENLVRIHLQQERDEDATAATTPDELASALAFFGRMLHPDRSIPPVEPRDWQNPGLVTLARNDFAEGRAAMSLDAVPFGRYTGPTFRWEVAPMPSPSGRPAAEYVSAVSGAIASASAHPAEAWEFLRFATGPEGAVVLAGAGELPAYNTPTVRAAWFARTQPPPRSTEILFKSIWLAVPQVDPDAPSTAAAFNNAVNRALTGQVPTP